MKTSPSDLSKPWTRLAWFDGHAIHIDIPAVQRLFPRCWRRKVVALAVHETVHAIQDFLAGPALVSNILRRELFAYWIERVFSGLLGCGWELDTIPRHALFSYQSAVGGPMPKGTKKL